MGKYGWGRLDGVSSPKVFEVNISKVDAVNLVSSQIKFGECLLPYRIFYAAITYLQNYTKL
jgi:hypothetical protein